MAEYWEFNAEDYWLEKAMETYENEPSIDNLDKVVQEVEALKQRRQWEIDDAKEHLARLERLIPDMMHKAKNRESYQRTR